MANVEYTRKRNGLTRNRHFDAGQISGIGIGIFFAGFLTGNIPAMVGGPALWLAGLFYEARITGKVMRQRSKDRQQTIKK